MIHHLVFEGKLRVVPRNGRSQTVTFLDGLEEFLIGPVERPALLSVVVRVENIPTELWLLDFEVLRFHKLFILES